MTRVDLKLGFACNNRCLFCVQGDKRSRYGPRDERQIESDLREGRRRGIENLVLTGGEPTLQPGFFPALRIARELGYRRIQVQTNARLFCYRKLCREVIEAGANEFSPALHAPAAALHDALTCAPGSFEQTLAGMLHLVELGQRVITNTVITERNYRELPALARLLVALGVQQFQLAFVHVVGTAHQNRHWLVPKKSAVMPYVREAIGIGRSAGTRCLTEAIPFCLMRGLEEHVAERIIPETRIHDADITIDSYSTYRRSEGKQKAPACAGCRWDAQCEGPWREYPELYGFEEFEPVA